MMLGRTTDEAWDRFRLVQPPFVDFRDASCGQCTYRLTIFQCIRGLQYGIQLGWFDYKTFNVKEYEYYEKVENGDFNWTIPGKLIAFSNPANTPYDAEGFRTFTPEDYVPIFKNLGVTQVIRLNKPTYEASRFTKCGIKHFDLFFLDGSAPTKSIIKQFLSSVENEAGVSAVHCKAGLGRTGSLIGCYAMKHYKFRATDFIGWIRICRPGSILGPQ